MMQGNANTLGFTLWMGLWVIMLLALVSQAAAPAPLPAADVGFGLFYDFALCKHPEHEQLYFRQMAEYGCNTATVYCRSAADIVRQVDTALEEGLLDPRFPVFLLGPDVEKTAAYLAEARGLAKHADRWPEFLLYGPDEPKIEQEQRVRDFAEQAQAQGLRCGTAIFPASAFQYSEVLDICMVHAGSHYSRALVEKIAHEGHEFWAYTGSTLKGKNKLMDRYFTGLWMWKFHPRVFLAWAYHTHMEETPEGPEASPGLVGWREGIIDYRVLRALEEAIATYPRDPSAAEDSSKTARAAQWLQELEDSIPADASHGVPWTSFREKDLEQGRNYEWTWYDTAIPPVANFDLIRMEALFYIEDLTGEKIEIGE